MLICPTLIWLWTSQRTKKGKEKIFPAYIPIEYRIKSYVHDIHYMSSSPTFKKLRVIVYSLVNLILPRVSFISKQRNEYVSCDFLSWQCDRHFISPTCKGKTFAKYQCLEKLLWKEPNLDSSTAKFWIIFVRF